MSVHLCGNCGQPDFWDYTHQCKPVAEKRLREIIREELAAAGRGAPESEQT